MNSYQGIIIAAVCLVIGGVIGVAITPAQEIKGTSVVLLELQSEISCTLSDLDDNLARAAYDLGGTGLNTTAARTILLELNKKSSAIIDSTTVSPEGVIIAAEPVAYHTVEGTDVSDQPSNRHILATKRPVMSGLLQVAEGMDAVLVSAPVFLRGGTSGQPDGQFIGVTTVVIRPETLIGQVATPIVEGTGYSITVVDLDGRVLYDTDPDQIGLPLDDPVYTRYPQLITFVTRVTKERQGQGTYTFRDQTKEATWTTVSLHGTEWRVAVTQTI
ncbi:cache domain-containing protein [Methanocalculus sp.]|uniref:cache domain-containing protein n=1 Tax=Methanocalculus sp. TaxID=2004547 RepID=UPI00271EB1BE|nr:cache domain-containing protein [Methanocalculus sp.]MDO8842313.1 hypothetical protein [Methanocalculus sp.]